MMLPELTLVPLTLFEGLVDVDEGEVVALWVLEPHVAVIRFPVHRWNQETGRS